MDRVQHGWLGVPKINATLPKGTPRKSAYFRDWWGRKSCCILSEIIRNCTCYFVSRTPEKHRDISNVIGFHELTPEAIKHHLLLINCTPLGMEPDADGCVQIPWQGVGKDHLIVDLVYNPDVTTFMNRALENGAEVMNGCDMLRLQAEKSWDIWLKNGL